MSVLSPFAILQPKNLSALQSSFASIPISSRVRLALIIPYLFHLFPSHIWLALPIPCKYALLSIFLIFLQLSAHILRILPICLDFCHPNPKNASFSKNNSRKIWWIQENVVLLHSLSGKRYQTPLERGQKERVL